MYMDIRLEPIVKNIQEKFSATFEEFRDEVHLFLKPEQIVDALTLLRDEHKFELLSALTAVDYYPQTSPRFHVVYQLTSLAQNLSLQIRVPVNGTSPKVPTATGLYGMANWRERLFAAMSRNAGGVVEFFRLPDNAVVELGTRVQI